MVGFWKEIHAKDRGMVVNTTLQYTFLSVNNVKIDVLELSWTCSAAPNLRIEVYMAERDRIRIGLVDNH